MVSLTFSTRTGEVHKSIGLSQKNVPVDSFNQHGNTNLHIFVNFICIWFIKRIVAAGKPSSRTIHHCCSGFVCRFTFYMSCKLSPPSSKYTTASMICLFSTLTVTIAFFVLPWNMGSAALKNVQLFQRKVFS